MASYPGTLSSFATHVNTTEIIDAAHPNLIQTELVAVETVVGLNPHISSGVSSSTPYVSTSNTFATVSARLTNIEAGVVGDAHTQYMHLRGGDTIALTAPSIVGWAVQTSAGQTADVWQVFDSSLAKRAWLNSSFQLNLTGGLNVTANGAVITGNTTVTGSLGTQQAVVSVPAVGGIGLIINLFAGQTADALQIKNSTGTVLSKFDANGNLTVSNMTVTGTQTLSGTTIYNGQADLTAVSGTASGSGTATGDKIELYSSGAAGVGFGYQTNKLVAYMPSGAAFVVRTASGSGNASSGTDSVTITPTGNITATGTVNGVGIGTGATTGVFLGSGGLYTSGISVRSQTNSGPVFLEGQSGTLGPYLIASSAGVSFDTGPVVKSCGADVVKTSTQTVPNDAAWHTVIFDTTRINLNSSYNSSTGVFTANNSGSRAVFTLNGYISAVGNVSGMRVVDSAGHVLWFGTVGEFNVTTSLAGGDTLQVQVFNNSGSSATIQAQNDATPVVCRAGFGVLR